MKFVYVYCLPVHAVSGCCCGWHWQYIGTWPSVRLRR